MYLLFIIVEMAEKKILHGTLLIVFLLDLTSVGAGQKLLFQKNRYRQAFYKEGDVISFRVRNEKSKYTEKIIGFEDSVIVFQHARINPSKITHLYVDGKTKVWYLLRYKYERIFLIAGVGYLLLEGINTGEVSEETLIISGSLVGAGFLARWLISDRIKIKGRRKLVILH